jgi:hypothetical protein
VTVDLAIESGLRRGAGIFFSRRPKLYKFCLQSAVRIFPIGAAHFFIIDDILHRPGGCAFHDACFVCDFENARRFFSADRECFVLLIDC